MIEFITSNDHAYLSLTVSERSDSLICSEMDIQKKNIFYANGFSFDGFNYPIDGIDFTYSISGWQNI